MDRDLYAARIEALLKDKILARAMGGRGQHALAQSFSFTQYMDSLEQLLLRVAAPPPPQTATPLSSCSTPGFERLTSTTTTKTTTPKAL